jgi:aldehyde dehydrogenase (NAD+)
MESSVRDSPDYDLPSLVDTQKAFFTSGGTRSVAFRKEKLQALEQEITQRSDELIAALAADLRKPALEAYLSEVYFVLKEIRLFRRKLSRWSRPKRVGNPFYFFPARSEIRPEPFGCALITAPWNYPVQLSLSPLIAAVAAGNCVILKPSELAPATANLLEELIRSVFSPAHVTVVQGGPEIGKDLLLQPFDFWFFTGNERIGRLYAEAAAKNLAPAVLELGGKCPCVVADDVDLDITVERILTAKFFNAGQTCIAPDFVLIPESLRKAFVEKAKSLLNEMYGTSQIPDLASIVNQEHYSRLLRLLPENAIQAGEDDPGALRLAPRLLPDSNWHSPEMQEEIFGPVLPVIGYDKLENALTEIAARPSPLALYAFSHSSDTLERIAASVRSGSVCFNDALKQGTNLNLPFGGVGASGLGRYRGRAGFEAFSYLRAVTKRYFLKDFFAVKPPYGSLLEKMQKFMK